MEHSGGHQSSPYSAWSLDQQHWHLNQNLHFSKIPVDSDAQAVTLVLVDSDQLPVPPMPAPFIHYLTSTSLATIIIIILQVRKLSQREASRKKKCNSFLLS